MMRVWAEALVSRNKLAQHKGVGAQLQVYIFRDGSKLGHSGVEFVPKTSQGGQGPANPEVQKISDQLFDIAQTFLGNEYRDVKDVQVTKADRSSLSGALTYEVSGKAMAAKEKSLPRELTYFQFKVGFSHDGIQTSLRGNTWTI